MRPSSSRTAIVCLLATALVAGCGTHKPDAAAADTAAAQDDTASAAPAPAQENASAAGAAGERTSAPLAIADIERWQRGVAAELEAVHEAGAKLASAKTGEDTLNATFAATEMSTVKAGASAAGVSEDRYRFIRETLSSAVAHLSPLEAELNVSEMPASMVEELKKGREAALARMSGDVPAEVMEALRPHAAELRKRDLILAGERVKAVGGTGAP